MNVGSGRLPLALKSPVVLQLSYPQTPVALICNNTSPFAGAYTGASCNFRLWSAVTCSEGFGSGVLIVGFCVAWAMELEDESTSAGAIFTCRGVRFNHHQQG
jgi:hypothetical protein